MPAEEFITNEIRAEEEHRSVDSIHQENHRGLGPPAYRIGRRLLYKRSEVEAWRQSRLVTPGTPT